MTDSIQPYSQAVARPIALPPAAMKMVPPSAGPALTPKEIVGILRQHVWMILIFIIVGTILGGTGFAVMRIYFPKYTALTGINVLPPLNEPPLEIRASQVQKDLYYQFRFTKATLMKQQERLEELLTLPDVRKTSWFRQFTKTGPDGEILKWNIQDAMDDLNKNLRVGAPRDQDIITISMTCSNPKEAADIVNEMVRIFVANQQQLARSGISEQLTAFRKQLSVIQNNLTDIQNRLDTLRSGTPFARLNIEGANFRDYMDTFLGDLENNYSELESQQKRLETTIAILKQRALTQEYDRVVQETMERDPVVLQLRNTINNTEAFLAEQLARFGQNHRRVAETRQSLENLKSQLDSRMVEIAEINRKSAWQQAEDEMAALTQELQSITAQLQEARKNYKDVDDLRADYAKHEIQREEQQAMLTKINEHIENLLAMDQNPDLSKLRPLGRAREPLEISSPNIKIYLPAGFILGMLAGVGLAFAVEMLNDLVRSPRDVMRHLKSPLLGTICHVDDDDEVDRVELPHVVRQAPYSIMSEGYRQLRTHFKLSPGSESHKALLITSPAAGDGKTTLATNLTSTLLAENKKVLLIDANFRRPSTGHLFPRTGQTGTVIEHPDFGLSNYLMGQCSDVNQVIRPSGIANLDIIDSGPLPANPAELLDSPRMKNLLDACKERYDHVLLDGPPLMISDAKTLASIADGILLVLNAAATHRGAASRVLRELQNIHANTIGIVLIGVKSRKGGYFQEVYRSYLEYQRVQINPVR